MKKTIHILTIVILIFTSCKKIESDIENMGSNSPIYQVKGNVDQNDYELIVDGQNTIINSGEFLMNNEPAYFCEIINNELQDGLKIILIAPELKKTDISNIDLNDYKANYLVHKPNCMYFDFGINSEVATTLYYKRNGVFENKTSMNVLEYGKYDVEFKFKGNNTDVFCFSYENGFHGIDLNSNFSIFYNSGLLTCQAENTKLNHNWKIDGAKVGETESHEMYIANGIHEIKHTIKDELGNQKSIQKLISLTNGHLNWAVEIKYCDPDYYETEYGKIIIERTLNNETFSSAYHIENDNKQLEIKDLEYFVEDESDIYLKFTVVFNCKLFNKELSKSVDLDEMIGTFKIQIN